MRLPTLFISHGAPDLALSDLPVTRFLRKLGRNFSDIRAIVVASAHWLTHRPVISAETRPVTLHDYYWGPDSALYDLEYPVFGAPAIAMRCLELLQSNGLQAELVSHHDLDHGVWVPLMHLQPDAVIPVVPLSIQPLAGAQHHFSVGQALAPLRDEGVLIIGSGAITHNLAGIRSFVQQLPVEPCAEQFSDWVRENIETRALHKLMNFQQEAPFAKRNHPGDEHFLPLFIALGAADDEEWTLIHNSWTYGVLAMDVYQGG